MSNLPFLSKVLERVVLTQLMTHLETHNLLEPFQSAYWKCHSAETALLRVVNDLLQASDDGHVSILSLLDFSAAFDTIDHVILGQPLASNFGCTGTVLGWFESYLSNRTQSVFVNDVQSLSINRELPSVHVWNTYGKRSFSAFGPATWNSLPVHVRQS